MSLWTKIRDAAESVASSAMPVGDIRSDSAKKQKSGVAGVFNKLKDAEGNLISSITGLPSAAEKAEQARMMNEQIKAYKDQTELTKQSLEETRNARDAERRRVEAKQIRGLRNTSRSAGFLNNEPSGKLGGSPNLPRQTGGA